MKTDWQTKRLGDVCEIINGSTPLRSNKTFWDHGDVSWFTVDDIREQGRIIRHTKQKITKTALGKTSARLLPPESVLLCCTASVGEYALTKISLTTNQQFNGLVIKDRKTLDPVFLFYFSSTLKNQLLGLSGKTTIDFIPISRLKEIETPIPPLNEQKRIVKKLDDVFEKITKVKEAAEKNLQNSKELFESYSQGVFANPGKDWEEKKLMDVCEKITQGPNPKYDNRSDNNYRVLKTKSLYDDIIHYEEADRISKKVFESCLQWELKNGDVLLAIVGQGSINKCNVFDNKTNARYIYTRALGLIRTERTQLDPYFLRAFLQSKQGKRFVDSGIGGTSGQQVVTTTHIKALKIFLPLITEQKSILKKLDALSITTKKLEKIYEQKLVDLEELKKSILSKAFHAEL